MSLVEIFKKYNTNITIDISPRIISCLFGDAFFTDVLEELNLDVKYVISPLHVSEYQTNIELFTYLVDKDSKEIVGRFTITCISKPENPELIFTSLTISIGDEDNEDMRKYLGRGLTRLLMGINLQIFYNIFQRKDKNLIIDADASGGFWDKIGMIETPESADDDRSGYEKYILLKDAYLWALKKPCEIDWCLAAFKKVFIKPTTTAKGKRRKGKKSKRRKKSKKN